MTCPVEINGVGTEAKVPMGILEIKFEIIPRLSQVYICKYLVLLLNVCDNLTNG